MKQKDTTFRQIVLNLTNKTYHKHREGIIKIQQKINHELERKSKGRRRSHKTKSKSFSESLLNVADFDYRAVKHQRSKATKIPNFKLLQDRSNRFLMH